MGSFLLHESPVQITHHFYYFLSVIFFRNHSVIVMNDFYDREPNYTFPDLSDVSLFICSMISHVLCYPYGYFS